MNMCITYITHTHTHTLFMHQLSKIYIYIYLLYVMIYINVRKIPMPKSNFLRLHREHYSTGSITINL